MHPILVSRRLARDAGRLRFAPPVVQVYNPLIYARGPHEAYLETFARPKIPALLLGMNPGPFGMAQTGVPFGEVSLVRDWLGLEGKVKKPHLEHPKRPILGFACERSEVSGRRLWSWARENFETPERFFSRFFVWNYCPLAFLEESGRNRTPDKLPTEEREPLFAVCDAALRRMCRWLEPLHVIGVGAFAEKRARVALGDDLVLGSIPHPSPANPAANRGWSRGVARALDQMGIAWRSAPEGRKRRAPRPSSWGSGTAR